MFILNVLLLYHIHQASEQAETTRAYFKQHDGLMLSPVRFSPKKFEEYLQTGKSVFKCQCHTVVINSGTNKMKAMNGLVVTDIVRAGLISTQPV